MALNCIGMFGGGHGSLGSSSPGSSSSSWSRVKTKNIGSRRKGNVVVCVASSSSWSSVMDPYKTLNIKPGASESEVKKAFRQLALRYHPDVCRETDCNVQFSLINEAYDIVMEHLREESSGVSQMYESSAYEPYDQDVDDEGWRGMMSEPDWELWEEWMGWEGAGIRDYTSHINPYI